MRGIIRAYLGVTALDLADAGPAPTALAAFTVKVYFFPAVSPFTTIGLFVPFTCFAPGLEYTVYEVILLPPLLVGG